jgi:A/G-specific adenine glycosylase
MAPEEFSRRVLGWFDDHGRKDLPWQRRPTPYRVWVSEIMLQQTQVATVIPYFQRFVDRFPDVGDLACADLDEVLHLWSGLGYYARARNLHQAAVLVRDVHHGELPKDVTGLCALPGIGRSTAGAILALSTGARFPILDGNVKRVLARFAAIDGWPGRAEMQSALWDQAERLTPRHRVAEYTQGMMDLGATVCTRSRPLCHICPLSTDCQAHAQGRESALPTRRPRRELPLRETGMLMLCAADGEVLLEQRPPSGVWGGLWSFPECPVDTDVLAWCRDELNLGVESVIRWKPFRHTFSHFRLEINPMQATVVRHGQATMEPRRLVWYTTRQPDERGLAAPMQRLLSILAGNITRRA